MQRIKYIYVILLALVIVLSCEIVSRNVTFEDVDFLAFYTAGKIINEGDISNLYNFSYQYQLNQEVRAESGIYATNTIYTFINPPVYSLLISPFAKLPYLTAFALWRILSLSILLLCSWILVKELQMKLQWYHIAVAVFISYPAIIAFKLGQNSFISLGIYTAVFVLLRRGNDFPAGLILSLGLLKPQLFFLLPCTLVMLKKWRATLGFTVGSTVFCLISFVSLGVKSNFDFIALITSSTYKTAWIPLQSYMHSIPAFFGILGGADRLVVAAITATTILFAIFLAVSYKRKFDSIFALAIVGNVLSSPHLFHYDLLILAIPCLILFQTKEIIVKFSLAAFFVLMWLSQFYIKFIPIQITVLLIVWIFILIWRKPFTTAEHKPEPQSAM